jgi:hypothetical protein
MDIWESSSVVRYTLMEVRLVAERLKSLLEQLFGLPSAKPIALYEESKK